MVTKEKLKKLYENVKLEKEITTSLLNECGFSSNDITKLVKDNYIDRIKRGYYSLKLNINSLADLSGVNVVKINDFDEEFLKQLDENISSLDDNKPIFLMEPLSVQKCYKLRKYIKSYPEVVVYMLPDNDKKYRLAVKKIRPFDPNLNAKQIINESSKAIKAKNYETAINLLQNMITFLPNPKAFVYELLSFSYKCLEMDEQANMYSIIHSGVSYYEEKREKRKKVTSAKKEINYDKCKSDINFLGITNLEEVALAIYANNGNVELACQGFELSEEQILLIKIVCARVYYQDNNYIKGDLLLREVERAKDKTECVKRFYAETLKNKKFYKNKDDEVGKRLAVVLQNKQIFE